MSKDLFSGKLIPYSNQSAIGDYNHYTVDKGYKELAH